MFSHQLEQRVFFECITSICTIGIKNKTAMCHKMYPSATRCRTTYFTVNQCVFVDTNFDNTIIKEINSHISIFIESNEGIIERFLATTLIGC